MPSDPIRPPIPDRDRSVPELFDHVVLLNGELIAAGPTAEVFTEENIRKTYTTRVFSGIDHGLAV